MIRWLTLTTDGILSTHCSANRMPTPPTPDKSPFQKNFYMQFFSVIFLVELPFPYFLFLLHLVSWRQHNTSTCYSLCNLTCLTFHGSNIIKSTNFKINWLMWSLDIDLARPISNLHPTSNITFTLSFGNVFSKISICHIHSVWSRIFMAGCTS